MDIPTVDLAKLGGFRWHYSCAQEHLFPQEGLNVSRAHWSQPPCNECATFNEMLAFSKKKKISKMELRSQSKNPTKKLWEIAWDLIGCGLSHDLCHFT